MTEPEIPSSEPPRSDSTDSTGSESTLLICTDCGHPHVGSVTAEGAFHINGKKTDDCFRCGSPDLRPLYVDEI